MIEILVLFVVGIGVGTFGTLIGIGGGLIMIPLFTFALTPSIFHSAPEIVGTCKVCKAPVPVVNEV